MRNLGLTDMKTGLLFLLPLLWVNPLQAQSNPTGIYLPLKCSRHLTTYIVTLSNKPICLANNPIIPVTEFETLSPLVEDGDAIYFEVTFSPAGYTTLNKLNQSFPYTEMALMVDRQVFITFNMADKQVNRTFRFQGQWKDKESFYIVHDKLSALKSRPN